MKVIYTVINKLLSSGNLSISAIAGLCGYSNVDYFSTAFKKEKGMTPTRYRRRE